MGHISFSRLILNDRIIFQYFYCEKIYVMWPLILVPFKYMCLWKYIHFVVQHSLTHPSLKLGSVQFSWACQTLCNPMGCSILGFLVLHQLPGDCSDSCSLSQWRHPNNSSSVISSFYFWNTNGYKIVLTYLTLCDAGREGKQI